MEKEYENYVHPERLKKKQQKGETINFPIRFFRENKSVADLKEAAKKLNVLSDDDSQIMNYQTSMFSGTEIDDLDKVNGDCFDSCEPFQ